jgi:hypothetical protein
MNCREVNRFARGFDDAITLETVLSTPFHNYAFSMID